MDEKTEIPAQLALLQNRYKQTTYTSRHSTIVTFTTWEMNVEFSPSTNYTKLTKLRKEVHQFSPGTKLLIDFMWNLFIVGLPSVHEYIILAEKFSHNMIATEHLDRLDEKWTYLQIKARGSERAFQSNMKVNGLRTNGTGSKDFGHIARKERDTNC